MSCNRNEEVPRSGRRRLQDRNRVGRAIGRSRPSGYGEAVGNLQDLGRVMDRCTDVTDFLLSVAARSLRRGVVTPVRCKGHSLLSYCRFVGWA